MTKYRNDLEYTVVIPTIGVTVEPGKSFDGPDNLSIAGISNAGKGKESVSVPTVAADLETGE